MTQFIIKKDDGSYRIYDAELKNSWTAQEWADKKTTLQARIDEIDANVTIAHNPTEFSSMMDAYKATHSWDETALYYKDLEKRSSAAMTERNLKENYLAQMNNDVKRLVDVPGG